MIPISDFLVSVIIPIYCVERYLDRCVTSVVNQTYNHLEIILVDDGSPDTCPMMCDQWVKRDQRIKVIHKKNGGLSDARNIGIDRASGKYLVFVDGDDYILPTMIEKLVEVIQKDKSDIAFCSFFYDYGEYYKSLSAYYTNKHRILNRNEVITDYFLNHALELVVVWNKLYKKKLFFTEQRIRFPIGHLHEDEYTSYKLLYEAKSISWINIELYGYVQRGGSIMSNFNSKHISDILGYISGYFNWYREYAPSLKNLIVYSVLNSAFDWDVYCYKHPGFDTKYELRNGFNKLFDNGVILLSNSYIGWKEFVKFFLWRCHCLVLVVILWNCIKRLVNR